jgi:glycosyltransferase involved in cell wall biosynthesis
MNKQRTGKIENNQAFSSPYLRDKIRGKGPVDLIVGVLCKNVEHTILHVLNVISEGLHKYFPEYTKAIVVSDGFSSDRTVELANLFQPYNGINKIVVEDVVEGGKGAGVRTILEVAEEMNAKAIALVDGDLLSVKPEWIKGFLTPILFGRAELVIPYYIRDKYDGVITNNLAYPFTRALYGLDIRQPLAGEFGISKRLYGMLREHPLFPLDFGIDIFIVTSAIANKLSIKEGLYSIKIHESTTMYLEPETLLIPMFRQVTGEMFELATYYEHFWRDNVNSIGYINHSEYFTQKPIPVTVDLRKMKKKFKSEFMPTQKMLKNYLPADLVKDLEPIGKKIEDFTMDLWAESVYHFASSYKKLKRKTEKYVLLDTLKTLWFGRFTNFVIETADMDINQAERIIQKQAHIFEEKFMDFCQYF